MTELELTLGDAIACTTTHMHHVVGVEHAEFLLAAGKASDLVTEASCAVTIFGTQHEEVRVLQRTHTVHAQIPAIKFFS